MTKANKVLSGLNSRKLTTLTIILVVVLGLAFDYSVTTLNNNAYLNSLSANIITSLDSGQLSQLLAGDTQTVADIRQRLTTVSARDQLISQVRLARLDGDGQSHLLVATDDQSAGNLRLPATTNQNLSAGKNTSLFIKVDNRRLYLSLRVFEIEGSKLLLILELDTEHWLRQQLSHGVPVIIGGIFSLLVYLLLRRDQAKNLNLQDRLRLTQNSINIANDPIIWVDRDGFVAYANLAAGRWLNLQISKLGDIYIWDVLPDFKQKQWHDHWRQLKKSRQLHLRLEVKPAGGDSRTFESYHNYIHYGEEEYDVIFGYDITEKLNLKNLTEASQQKYWQLFEQITDPISFQEIITDANGQAVDFVFRDVNKAFEQESRISRGSLIGRTGTEIFTDMKDDRLDWLHIFQQTALEGKDFSFEAFFPPLGKWYEISLFSPKPRLFAMILNDVNDRHQRQAALNDSEEWFRAIFDRLSDAIFIIDQQTAKIISQNFSAQQQFGYSPAELSSMNPDQLSNYNERYSIKQLMSQLQQQNDMVFELTLYTKHGKSIATEISARLTDYDGRQVIMLVIRDIGQRQQRLAEMEKEYQELQAARERSIARELAIIRLKQELAKLEKPTKKPL